MFQRIKKKWTEHKDQLLQFHRNWDQIIKTDEYGKNEFMSICRKELHNYLEDNNLKYNETEGTNGEDSWIEGNIIGNDIEYWIYDITVSIRSNRHDTYIEYYDYQSPDEMISKFMTMIRESLIE